MALSVTYSPRNQSTKAVLYGCTEAVREAMIHRLARCNHVVNHPLAIPTMFCDIERMRQFNLVYPLIRKAASKLFRIDKPQHLTTSDQTTGLREDPEDLVTLWAQLSDLKRGLETWNRQLENLISHCEDLVTNPAQLLSVEHEVVETIVERQYVHAGKLIQQHLVELKCEYEEKIRQCADIIEGMVLAAQQVRFPFRLPFFQSFYLSPSWDSRSRPGLILEDLQEWNTTGQNNALANLRLAETNTAIATATQAESRQMRSIAVLTMVYLPATFVAVGTNRRQSGIFEDSVMANVY